MSSSEQGLRCTLAVPERRCAVSSGLSKGAPRADPCLPDLQGRGGQHPCGEQLMQDCKPPTHPSPPARGSGIATSPLMEAGPRRPSGRGVQASSAPPPCLHPRLTLLGCPGSRCRDMGSSRLQICQGSDNHQQKPVLTDRSAEKTPGRMRAVSGPRGWGRPRELGAPCTSLSPGSGTSQKCGKG